MNNSIHHGAPGNIRPIVILLADDSEDDRLMTHEALIESERSEYSQASASPRPGLILLDLNMPRKSGHEALLEIKADPVLRRIPVIALTTSRDEEDIVRSYDLGVSSFISKPVTFEGLVEVMKTIGKYWVDVCAVPPISENA